MLAYSADSLRLKVTLNSTITRDFLVETLLSSASITSHVGRLNGILVNELYRNGENRWTRNEYENWVQQLNISPSYSLEQWVEQMFSRFFYQDGMCLYANQQNLEEYAGICRECHPFLLIAPHWAQEISEGNLSLQNTELLSENLTENVLQRDYNFEVAENHCHYGGANNNNNSLFALLQSPVSGKRAKGLLPFHYLSDRQKLELERERELFCLVFHFLSEKILYPEKPSAVSEFNFTLRMLWEYQTPLNFSKINSPKHLYYFFQLNDLPSTPSPAQQLLRLSIKQFYKGYWDSALILYLTAIRLLSSLSSGNENRFIQILSWLFALQLNRFRSGMVMTYGNGLKDFVCYYNSTLRKQGNHNNDAIRAILVGGTGRVELRQGKIPSRKEIVPILQEIGKTLHKRYPEYAMTYQQEIWDKIPHPAQAYLKYDFGYHFIKTNTNVIKNIKKVLPPSCYRKTTQELRNEKIPELLHFFRSSNNRIKLSRLFPNDSFHIQRQLSDNELDIRLLLRILDAAGDENLIPPEVFAPFVRYLRSYCPDMKWDDQNKRVRKLRLAFHAGEDFAHIITGMRRVDETVQFMNYEAGDRLGHVLALGVLPSNWLKNKREFCISVAEDFDNILWLWKMSIRMTPLYSKAAAWTDFYAERVRQYLPCLYPAFATEQLDFFWEAYKLRRNLPTSSQQPHRIGQEEYYPDYPIPDIRKTEWNIYQYYLNEENNPRIEWEKTVRFRDKRFFQSHDSKKLIPITEDELDFWQAVQDYQLRQCSENEYIFEANPSSNVCIGEFDRYELHPIFRWVPVQQKLLMEGERYNRFGLRKGPISVCVNSDDPGIFSTTLQNEFRLLRLAAIRHFSHEEVDVWLEKLRKKGIEVFEQNYIYPYFPVNS